MVKYLRIRCCYKLGAMRVGDYDLDNLRRQMDRIDSAAEEYKQRFSLFIKAARKLEDASREYRVWLIMRFKLLEKFVPL